jgi:hypothetical protein
MSAEECVLAIQNTLNEIKNVCPQVSNTFIFKQDNNVLAKDKETDEATITRAVEAFSALNKRGKAAGGLESVTFEGADNRATVTRVNNLYLATLASKDADEKTLHALTRVIVPTVIKLVELIQPELTSVSPEFLADVAEADGRSGDLENCETEQSTVAQFEPKVTSKPLLPDALVSQLIVENITGLSRLIGSQDTVRVDTAVIFRWGNLYGDRAILEVEVEETRTGQTARCKVKPIKDSQSDGSVIQLPEKVQSMLQTKKGALVMVKPVIE